MTLRPIPSPLDPRAAELTIVEAAGLAQARAAWPGWSAWVSANAGSGKTRVLTSRVARLLLRGAKPAKILCLTYTKAAAAEMTNRLTETLGRWALLDDDALSRELAELEAGLDPSERAGVDLGQARRLFAEALETPGGLKIQTIHAFCDAVLRRFPLEAGVSPDFTVIDDAARRALALEARDALAEDAASGRDDAFDAVAAHLTDEGLDALIDAILARRALFADPPGEAALRAAFGVGQADLDIPPLETFRRALDADALAYAGGLLCEGSVTERPRGVALKAAAAAPDAGAVAEALDAALLTRKGAPLKSQVTKATAARADWLRPFLEDLAAGFLDAQESDRAVAGFRRAQALNRFAARLLARYAAARRARGALDYDDLIEGVAGLFSRSEMAAWALFKLDGGIDHVLVDEAQDTAPAQWAVIEALTAEFFAGAGRARAPGALDRTVFVVGDEKQSIYSFQGAEPGVFGAKRTGFRERAVAADKPFEDKVTLATSFRSAPAILTVVDRVCAVAPEGLASPEEDIAHYAARADRPGRVDLWPLLPKPETAEEPPWDRARRRAPTRRPEDRAGPPHRRRDPPLAGRGRDAARRRPPHPTRRRDDPRAPARPAGRRAGPLAQAPRRGRRRRRPAEAGRGSRRARPAGAGALRADAGRRPHPRRAVALPALRAVGEAALRGRA
jgi:ATP-dependent helicase/nuclease subunit A